MYCDPIDQEALAVTGMPVTQSDASLSRAPGSAAGERFSIRPNGIVPRELALARFGPTTVRLFLPLFSGPEAYAADIRRCLPMCAMTLIFI